MKSDEQTRIQEDQLIQSVVQDICSELDEHLKYWFENAFLLTESPIERRMLLALLKHSFNQLTQCRVVHPSAGPIGVVAYPIDYHDEELLIRPQESIGKYRVDFLLTWRSKEILPRSDDKFDFVNTEIKVIVECDGHEFHEKTKEQASRDKKRDRDLQTMGYYVFRYSGSDIYRKSDEYAQEVITFIKSTAEREQEEAFSQAMRLKYPDKN
jgi:very-short-patch-repair endonuclease